MHNIIITTSRTYLRQLTVEDAVHFFNLNNDPDVLQFTGDEPFNTVADAATFLAVYDQYTKYNVGRWAVMEKERGDFIGWCGLKYHPDTNEYDIGFRFFKKYWNQGFATETAAAVLDYGFNVLHIPVIIGRAMRANSASIKVLEKIGMQFDKHFDFDGRDGVLYIKHRKLD